MKSLWSDTTAAHLIDQYAAQGEERDMALRVYSSRLLGSNPSLVLHGGGNTSYKSTRLDLMGNVHDVLCIKGSGWNLDTIEPAGLPAVSVESLLDARNLDKLSDEDMVALQRSNLLNPSAPNPSVETLLHAYIPLRYVDHTHSTAVLALVDQPDSEEICDSVFGDRIGFVPYVMPGFELAKRAAKVFDENPQVEGLILDKHGIVTFGCDASESYERMIELVNLAEARISASKKTVFGSIRLPNEIASVVDVAPIVRGAVARALPEDEARHQVLDFRTNPEVMNFVNGEDLNRYAQQGVSTPDLSIRIKYKPLLLPPPVRGDAIKFAVAVEEAVLRYASEYREYFERCDAQDSIERTMLDPLPRVALVPGLGLFGIGDDIVSAAIAADVAENWIEAVTSAERVGTFSPASERELFELEYWSLEQAKLGGRTLQALSGQVAVITGGAGAIGRATSQLFAARGAHVVIADVDGDAATAVADAIGTNAIAVQCDVTEARSVADLFEAAIQAFGGVDIAVSNAGSAIEGEIATLPDDAMRRSFELNFFAHQTVAQHAVNVMRTQDTGGVLLFNASKQAVNPGPHFGAYGTAKAATLFLSRQYALECGQYGIRANAVNADRIRSGLLHDDMIARRAKSRSVSETEYLCGNLLGKEVRAEDVAQAFFHLALAGRTTAGVTTVDGGNIAAALR